MSVLNNTLGEPAVQNFNLEKAEDNQMNLQVDLLLGTFY